MKPLEILIIEDNPSHLQDAKLACQLYRNITFSYAQSLDEATRLLDTTKFDGVVSDVFFLSDLGDGEICVNYGSALEVGKRLQAEDIPFVFNTAGSHHGDHYREFLQEWRHINTVGRSVGYGFESGKLVEMPDTQQNGHFIDAPTKQWFGPIGYVILLTRKPELEEKDIAIIADRILPFAPYGDYGKLTEKLLSAVYSTPSQGEHDEDYLHALNIIKETISNYRD